MKCFFYFCLKGIHVIILDMKIHTKVCRITIKIWDLVNRFIVGRISKRDIFIWGNFELLSLSKNTFCSIKNKHRPVVIKTGFLCDIDHCVQNQNSYSSIKLFRISNPRLYKVTMDTAFFNNQQINLGNKCILNLLLTFLTKF